VPPSPRPNSGCPAAIRCCAAAFSASSSASPCADPRCSISRDPLRDDHTTCTAVAPDVVFTVRMYGTRPPYGPGLVRKFSTQKPKTSRSAPHNNDHSQIVAQVRSDVVPGNVNDLAAARENVLEVLRLFVDEMPALADCGYEGAGHGVINPVKRPAGMKELDINARTPNALIRSVRCLGERGFALLTLADTPAHHRQPRQDRPDRTRGTRPNAIRAQDADLKAAEKRQCQGYSPSQERSTQP
jgi:hypothetical protein